MSKVQIEFEITNEMYLLLQECQLLAPSVGKELVFGESPGFDEARCDFADCVVREMVKQGAIGLTGGDS